jgi:hypothetical protein
MIKSANTNTYDYMIAHGRVRVSFEAVSDFENIK